MLSFLILVQSLKALGVAARLLRARFLVAVASHTLTQLKGSTMNSTYSKDSPASQFVAVAAFAATIAGTKDARAYAVRGDLCHNSCGLDVASMSGNILFGPMIDDAEPVAFLGDLVVDSDASTAVLSFTGSAVKRTGAFTYDIATGNLWSGMLVQDTEETGVIDVLRGYDFDLQIETATGVGTFSFLKKSAAAVGKKQGTIGTVRFSPLDAGGSKLELIGIVCDTSEPETKESLQSLVRPTANELQATSSKKETQPLIVSI